MGYDRGDSFPFDFEPNGFPFGSKSKGKLSPRSYPIQCERKWKYSFLSVGHAKPVQDTHMYVSRKDATTCVGYLNLVWASMQLKGQQECQFRSNLVQQEQFRTAGMRILGQQHQFYVMFKKKKNITSYHGTHREIHCLKIVIQ